MPGVLTSLCHPPYPTMRQGNRVTQNPLETDTSLQRAIDYQEHALQAGGVSKAGSTLMAVAGSAPAYSIAASR